MLFSLAPMHVDALSQPAVAGTWRTSIERLLLFLTLITFAALAGYGISVHEPWLDEAHAWLLARDASTLELLTTYLRYEGHPPLWYLILKILTTLQLPYVSMKIASWAIAVVGIAMFHRLQGVPLVIKLLLPFTYFLAYQYVVIARSYVLLFPLIAAITWLYSRRSEKIWTFTVLLILLSNVSVHGLMLAGALTSLYIVDVLRGRQIIAPGALRQQLIALFVLLLNVAVLVAVLWPPPDLAIKAILNYKPSPLRMYWLATSSLLANLGDSPLSLGVLVLLVFWFHRRGVLLEFVLILGSITPIATLYFNSWHEGLFVLALFFTMLIAYTNPGRITGSVADRRLTLAVTIVFCLAVMPQLIWTWKAMRYDAENPYSGSRAAALFIRHYGLHEKQLYGAGFAIISIQPYFERNIFANYAPSGGYAFLDWTTNSSLYLTKASVIKPWILDQLRDAPEFFLISSKLSPEVQYKIALDADPRYRLMARFPGGLYWKSHIREREAFLLYGRVDALNALR